MHVLTAHPGLWLVPGRLSWLPGRISMKHRKSWVLSLLLLLLLPLPTGGAGVHCAKVVLPQSRERSPHRAAHIRTREEFALESWVLLATLGVWRLREGSTVLRVPRVQETLPCSSSSQIWSLGRQVVETEGGCPRGRLAGHAMIHLLAGSRTAEELSSACCCV